MEQKEITLGDKTFAFTKMNAFAAAQHLIGIKSVMEKGFAGGMDVDAIKILSGIDQTTIKNLIIPILRDAACVSVTDNTKIDSEVKVSTVFTVDNLFDFFVLAWEVIKYNFGPFFARLLALTGQSPDEFAAKVKSLAAK